MEVRDGKQMARESGGKQRGRLLTLALNVGGIQEEGSRDA